MINHIELAKECGAHIGKNIQSLPLVSMNPDELTAFANAIVDECAKVADDRQKQVGDATNEFSILSSKIRAMKG